MSNARCGIFCGHKFWARGYFVTTVGRDEEVIRAYIRNQELTDRQLEQFDVYLVTIQVCIHKLAEFIWGAIAPDPYVVKSVQFDLVCCSW